MAILYRTAGAWGAGTGVNLTPAQVDNNFYEIVNRLEVIEEGLGSGGIPIPNGIADISVVGSQMTITLDDATELGPFTLPLATWRFQGDWAVDTVYARGDVVAVDAATDGSQTLYLVLLAHTSESPFDPDRLIGSDPVYELVLSNVGSAGGTPGAVINVPEGASDPITISPTIDQGHGTLWMVDVLSESDFELPTNANVPFPIGTELHIWQWNTGQVHVFGDSGVNVEARDDTNFKTRAYGAVVTVKKTDTNHWILFGDLELVSG